MELYKESLRNNLYLDSIVYTPHVFSIVCTLRYTCSKEHGSKLFQFVEAKDEHLVLVHKPLFADPESVNVEFADLKKWRLSKQKPPEALPQEKVAEHRAKTKEAVENELHRCRVTTALLTASKENSEPPVTFVLRPNNVFLSTGVKKKHAFKIFPVGAVSKLNPKDNEGGKVVVEAYGSKWHVQAFKGLQPLEQGAFWWIKEAAAGEGNLEHSFVTVDGVKIPCLTNAGPIGSSTQLLSIPRAGAAQGDNAQAKKKAKTGAK